MTTKLYYWGKMEKFSGRGYPIALALEHAGEKYEVHEGIPDNAISFAVPVVTFSNGLSMSQLPMIMDVLGDKLGLGGATEAEKLANKQLLLDFNDIFNEVQKEGKWTAANGRKDKWFGLLEKRLQSSEYLVSSAVSTGDLFGLFVMFLVVTKTGPIDDTKFPKLDRWLAAMSALPAVAKLKATGVPIFPA